MGATETAEFRRRRKENLVRVCGNKCSICGYNKLKSALEFHHIDPTQKSYGVGANGNCHDLEKDLLEIKKCLLVCANCHREIHANLFSEKELWDRQVYFEDVAQELREEKYIRVGAKEYFCAECGKKITKDSSSGLCFDCANKNKRFVERPSREELKVLIRSKPFTHIAALFGVSDNAIRKWCKAEGLPSKSKEIKRFSDEEWEKM